MNRRQFCLGSVVVVAGVSGCATRAVWDDVSNTKYHTYYDQINAFYVNQDQSQFVVFVTPIVKTSASSGSEQIKKKFRLRD